MVALSKTEAEYMSMTEGIWLHSLVQSLSLKVEKPALLCDSQSALSLAKNLVSHERTKHIDALPMEKFEHYLNLVNIRKRMEADMVCAGVRKMLQISPEYVGFISRDLPERTRPDNTVAGGLAGKSVALTYLPVLVRSILFQTRWCEAGILKDLFPRIYALETYKDVNIRTKLEASSLETSLRHNVRGGAEQAHLIAASEVSSNITLSPQADRYNWLLNNDGVYSVASLRKKIDNRRFNLSRRGIDIESLMCPLCDAGIETSTHLFFRCNMADQIYYKIARWWNVTYEGFTSYTEWSRCKAAFTWNDWLKNPYLIVV
nr:RNA-directed DNA polymerase, eukaryota [Tanacetum cinerariifolium]